jgi:hypothetical protein
MTHPVLSLKRDVRNRQASRGQRLLIYAVAWLPALAVLFVAYPRLEPWFGTLEDQDRLPPLTKVLRLFVLLNEASYYLLAVVSLIALLAVDEVVLGQLDRGKAHSRWSSLWVWWLAGLGLLGGLAVWTGLWTAAA